ncbi:phloretin 4'-O-glucosyltransferase-like [Syzygium oleosum]|uniref:phloretin 4'-O-glucosyltransferase-like n=1 Tax=Syzygium oleosum TaxID=219896 RepID=UPI0024B88564|nr:phloretin 4'-O-glucosyltransferase-like [Syzygium oleosum]
MVPPRFLLVAFPQRGAMNPVLQLAERLARFGGRVTFLTTVYAHRCMIDPVCLEGVTFTTFSDGYDDGYVPGDDLERFRAEMKRRGSEALRGLIEHSSGQGLRFTCALHTMLSWVDDVARSLQIKSVLVWIQPATVFDIYYYYFNGYEDVIKNVTSQRGDTTSLIRLPGLPPLTNRDVPSFLHIENRYAFALPHIQTLLENLKEGENPKVVLVNTFDALELEALRMIGTLNLVGIGPLVPLDVLDSEKSSGSDRFLGSKDYVEWLNTKEEASVIYVAFGSIARLSKVQKREMARGLLETGRPFLWVMRNSDGDDDELFYKEELDKRGVIVPWCSQIEVLSHPSIGCFFTHCGWNSTVESLVCGIPMVAFPQWADQMTNAKLVENVWKVGIRVSEINEEGIIVEGGEIKKCLELVMGGGERGDEIRRNAKKWKDLAMEASREGGSSDKNLKAFVEEIAEVDIEVTN